MGTKRRLRAGALCASAVAAILMLAGPGRADVTSERPGSILILPKVVADGIRDTVIEISNTSNSVAHAHCYYVNGAPVNPALPPSPTNPPLWQETDFYIWLTRQQPTSWTASRGRRLDPTDWFGQYGSGIDPGVVPPVGPGFTGELVCVQVDASAAPVPGNALTGNATLIGPQDDLTSYNGIAVLGNSPNGDNELQLDGNEYNMCPASLEFVHIAEGAADPVLGGEVSNRLTLIPCEQNFENPSPTTVAVAVRSCDELENCLSADFSFQCWMDTQLDDSLQIPNNPFASFAAFGPFKYSQLTPGRVCNGGSAAGTPCQFDSTCPGGTCDGVVGLLGVLETTHRDGLGASARTAQNLHARGGVPGATITLIEP